MFEDEKSSFFVDTLGLEPKLSDGAIRHTVTPLLTILWVLFPPSIGVPICSQDRIRTCNRSRDGAHREETASTNSATWLCCLVGLIPPCFIALYHVFLFKLICLVVRTGFEPVFVKAFIILIVQFRTFITRHPIVVATSTASTIPPPDYVWRAFKPFGFWYSSW